MRSTTDSPGSHVPWWVWLSVAFTAAIALASLSYRYRVEQGNRAVMIAVEHDVVRDLAASQGVSYAEALRSLREQGVRAIVLPEEKVEDLVKRGDTEVKMGRFLLPSSPEASERLIQGLERRFPGSGRSLVAQATTANPMPRIRVPIESALVTSVGLSPATASLIREEGLEIIARHSNYLGATPASITDTVSDSKSLGANYFLAQGEQVLGLRDGLDSLIEALQQNEMLYCTPEFGKIAGDTNVKTKAPDITVRLHSAQPAELDKMGVPDIVERYSKAGRERNIRVLLVRPGDYSGEQPLADLGELCAKITQSLLKEGAGIGPARPFVEPGVPVWLFVLIPLAATPMLAWVGSRFVAGSAWLVWLVVVGLLVLGSVSASGRNFAALACASAFPVGAYLVAVSRRDPWPVAYLLMSAISLAGGLAAAGLLNGLDFMVQVDQFSGVKVAHFLPILVVGGWLLSLVLPLRDLGGSAVRWGSLGAALLALAALAFMQARTGNDNPAAVSGLELRLRSLLETVMFVRPRTKEFLIGYPALVLGLALLAQTKGRADLGPKAGWIAALLTVGAIGQTSLVNTMCHLHTPLAVGLGRIGIGWLLGGILGGLLWLVVRSLPLAGSRNA